MSTVETIPVIALSDAVLCGHCHNITPRQTDGCCVVCQSKAVINVTEQLPVVECEARLVEAE